MPPVLKVNRFAGIDCEGPVQQGMSAALNIRVEQMCALREAALDWSDPEGVHKMRVASRRLRGALRDFAPYIEKRRITSSLKHIKEIARALGRVRDQDVAIMTLERMAANAPPEIAKGISRLVQTRDADRVNARAKVAAILTPELLAAVTATFEAALARPPQRERVTRAAKQEGLSASEISYREAARTIIIARLDELEKLSTSLYQPLKTKPLHDLRIAAKHLRYALQLFEHCWGSSMASFAKAVAGLQSSLGKLHDCDAWIEDLGKIVNTDALDPDFDQRATVMWLLGIFIKLRGKHLGAALVQWQRWEAKNISSCLRESIGAAS